VGDPDDVKIGLEVHCQLTALKTKLFCSCSSDYRGKEPNETICPVCFGLPGTLPVVNQKAVEYAAMVGLALGSKVSGRSTFYRKNYFYPDLPKGFQISQYDKAGGVPIAVGGRVEVEGKPVRITRIQLEEDPGKLTYEGTIDKSTHSLVDYNRAGIALVEIVTEPDLSSPREAKLFLEKLRSTIESLGVSNGELEGAMRCDANVSLRGGARVEIKNISSFKEVEKALSYEILRQRTFSGNSQSETRHWDERRSITIAIRSKEEEQDYRYFPEPDLPAVVLEEKDVARVRAEMPEVAEARVARYASLGLSPQMARELANSQPLAAFFDECAKRFTDYPELASFMMSEFGGQTDVPVSPAAFVGLMAMIKERRVTRNQAKEVLREMVRSGGTAEAVVASKGLSSVVEEGAIESVVERVAGERPDLVSKAAADKKAFNYLIGLVLKEQPGAEPQVVAKLLARRTAKR
jgi:aspartyl-tRNA(Asn)/glutamyl-tRNA(Gln) amidotransferase subunit B